MKILIENFYVDGHQCHEIVELPIEPGCEPCIEELELSEWWNDKVHELTGCGHGAPENTPDGRSISATYVATITEATDPELIGRSTEWTG